jgi:hypothetical protein
VPMPDQSSSLDPSARWRSARTENLQLKAIQLSPGIFMNGNYYSSL